MTSERIIPVLSEMDKADLTHTDLYAAVERMEDARTKTAKIAST